MTVATKGNDNYKVSDVYSKQEAYPLIISFQNGILHRTGEVDFRGGIYSEKSSGKKTKNAIISIENMVYVGQEKEDNVCRNLIVVRNRNTGDVRLIEVGNARLKALPESEQVTKTEEVTSEDVTDKSYQLGEAFGSKRQKRRLEQSKKTKIDIDSMKEQLEKTISAKQIDVLELSQHEASKPDLVVEKYAPRMNREASNVKEVYQIEDFLNDEQFQTLKTTAKSVLEDKTFEIAMSDYIAEEIFALRTASTSTSEEKFNVCSVLLYADCIIRYLKEPYKQVCNPKYVVCGYSELIDKLTLNSFSMISDKGRMRPQTLKDKSVCYLLVLLLMAGNYKISDANKLCKAIGIPVTRLTQMAKVVGARVVSGDGTSKIVLSLPLAAPPVVMLGKRKRS